MNSNPLNMWIVMLGMALLPPAQAAPPGIAQAEINFLLAAIATSNCEFYRNGSWYDPKRAEGHLRLKYDYLAARNQIESSEEFIEKAASKSSFSGLPYLIRCSGHDPVTSDQWLREQLVRYREPQHEIATPLPENHTNPAAAASRVVHK